MFNPKKYSRNIDPIVKMTKQLIEKHGKLLKWKSKPESILDIGIGDGRIANEIILPIFPKNIKEYVGGDISEPMLNSAKTTIQHEKFKTMQIDIKTKNLPAEMLNRFDHVFTSYMFHHIQDTRQAIFNIKQMLKPKGQFFLLTYAKTFTDDTLDMLDEGKWKKYKNRSSISPFYQCEEPIKAYEEIIKELGFVDNQFFVEHRRLTFPEKSFEELASEVNLRMPYIEENDKEAYQKDYLQQAKKSALLKMITDDKTNETYVLVLLDVIIGVCTKPF